MGTGRASGQMGLWNEVDVQFSYSIYPYWLRGKLVLSHVLHEYSNLKTMCIVNIQD